jgi:hypothetical protein
LSDFKLTSGSIGQFHLSYRNQQSNKPTMRQKRARDRGQFLNSEWCLVVLLNVLVVFSSVTEWCLECHHGALLFLNAIIIFILFYNKKKGAYVELHFVFLNSLMEGSILAS